MDLYIVIEILSFLSFILFALTCFTRLDNNSDINKIVYIFNLFFLGIINLFHYFFVLNFVSNKLTLVTSLLVVITFLIFFILSVLSYQFVRYRILFIPFFLIILIFRLTLGFLSTEDGYAFKLFDNKYLVIHILTSLLSYSLLTISLVTSFCLYIQSLYIKKMKFNKIINEFLPSIYESELLAIRFLYLSICFLVISLLSGLYYFIESGEELIYFFNEKVIFSLITLTLILFIIFFRILRGLTGQMMFKMILLSYFLMGFSYFGLKLIS